MYSTSAQPAIFRPELDIDGATTRFLVDQIRTVDTRYVSEDPVHFLEYHEIADIEHAVRHYFGV